MLRTLASLLLLFQLCSAGNTVSIGLDSGLMAPLDSEDNLHYNPSIYIQPRLLIAMSSRMSFSLSYCHLFPQGNEYNEDEGIWGDPFGNYRTSVHCFKGGIGKQLGSLVLSSGIGFWYFSTERDLVGTWDAD